MKKVKEINRKLLAINKWLQENAGIWEEHSKWVERSDEYYVLQATLNKELKEVLYNENLIRSMSKKDLVLLIRLSSTHRPLALHSLLMCITSPYNK